MRSATPAAPRERSRGSLLDGPERPDLLGRSCDKVGLRFVQDVSLKRSLIDLESQGKAHDAALLDFRPADRNYEGIGPLLQRGGDLEPIVQKPRGSSRDLEGLQVIKVGGVIGTPLSRPASRQNGSAVAICAQSFHKANDLVLPDALPQQHDVRSDPLAGDGSGGRPRNEWSVRGTLGQRALSDAVSRSPSDVAIICSSANRSFYTGL